MKAALCIIATALLGAAIAGATVLRGGEYAMFLLALALVTFFGSLPVVLGVLSRPRTSADRDHEDASAVVIDRSDIGGRAPAGAARTDSERGA